MDQSPHRMIVDVHLLLVRDGEVLLSRRRGGYGHGLWHLPSGKTETDETVVDAVIRETREEIGVTVRPQDLRCVHALHVQHTGEEPRIGFFFEATHWLGEPANQEPDKCGAVQWFPLTDLPDGMIPYPAAGISSYLHGIPFSIFEPGRDTPRPISPPLCQPLPALTGSLPR